MLENHEEKQSFSEKCREEITREPTLFYLMKASSENNSKFRQAACQTLITLLENNDMLAKWQYILERKSGQDEIQSEGMGLFLRLIHYYMVVTVENETEFQMLQMQLKLCTTLLQITPYARMLPGLSTLLGRMVVQ